MTKFVNLLIKRGFVDTVSTESTQNTSSNSEREAQILDAAAAEIARQGYDKTTMSDIARAAGVSRGIVYLHFASKDALFEALLLRELLAYANAWLAFVEADPQGGTIAGVFRAVLKAVNSSPFMTALIKRDRRVYGNYLRKPNNMFSSMQISHMRAEFIQAMQAAGAIRPDVNPAIAAQIIDMLSYGLMGMYGLENVDNADQDNADQFDELMETTADMLDHYLTPEDGGDSEAGKAVIRELAATSLAHFESMHPQSAASSGPHATANMSSR